MYRLIFRIIISVISTLYLAATLILPARVGEKEVYSAVTPEIVRAEKVNFVNILQNNGEISFALQEAADEYARTQSEKVEFHIRTVQGEDYKSVLREGLIGGEQIDVFMITDGYDADSLLPYLEKVSDNLEWIKTAASCTTAIVAGGDGFLGAPYSLEGTGIIVNYKIFEKVGINIRDISSFENLSEAFASLAAEISEGKLSRDFPRLEAVTDIAGASNEYLVKTFSELMLSGAFSDTNSAHNAAEIKLSDTGPIEELIKMLGQASPHKRGWAKIAGVSEKKVAEEGIAVGRIAALLGSTELYRRVLGMNPEIADSLTFIPIFLEGKNSGIILGGTPSWWAINTKADSFSKRHAEGFLTWLYQSDDGKRLFKEKFGALSPYADLAAEKDPVYKRFLTALRNNQVTARLAQEAPAGWKESVFAAELREYFTLYDKEWADLVLNCENAWLELRETR